MPETRPGPEVSGGAEVSRRRFAKTEKGAAHDALLELAKLGRGWWKLNRSEARAVNEHGDVALRGKRLKAGDVVVELSAVADGRPMGLAERGVG